MQCRFTLKLRCVLQAILTDKVTSVVKRPFQTHRNWAPNWLSSKGLWLWNVTIKCQQNLRDAHLAWTIDIMQRFHPPSCDNVMIANLWQIQPYIHLHGLRQHSKTIVETASSTRVKSGIRYCWHVEHVNKSIRVNMLNTTAEWQITISNIIECCNTNYNVWDQLCTCIHSCVSATESFPIEIGVDPWGLESSQFKYVNILRPCINHLASPKMCEHCWILKCPCFQVWRITYLIATLQTKILLLLLLVVLLP